MSKNVDENDKPTQSILVDHLHLHHDDRPQQVHLQAGDQFHFGPENNKAPPPALLRQVALREGRLRLMVSTQVRLDTQPPADWERVM